MWLHTIPLVTLMHCSGRAWWSPLVFPRRPLLLARLRDVHHLPGPGVTRIGLQEGAALFSSPVAESVFRAGLVPN